ncbi:MAG: protein kinase domain-containing protein [Nannocystales bacterium]
MPSPAPPSPDLADLCGVVLDGRYEIDKPLSTGGMGSVYQGQQLALSRPVAIKVVKPGVMKHEVQVRRLVREAQTTALVKHPNVIEIIDVGVMEHGVVYLVMELLEGMDLRALLRQERRLPWPRVRNIAMQVVAALKAAHACGVIHRDIKPSNVFLVDQAAGIRGDFIKVLDFGLAKSRADGGSPALTGAEEVVGTAAYLAPEVARGKKADVRSEVYAVGVLMYKMATGTVPFKGSSPLDVLAKAISNPLPAPRTRNAELPAEADRIIRRCLAKRPDLRPQDMDALERDLHALGDEPLGVGESPAAAPATGIPTPVGERTVVTRAPLAPPASAPRFERRPPAIPTARAKQEDPSDVLEAAMSEVLELDVDDALEEDSGGRQPLRLVPDPEPGLPVRGSDPPSAPLAAVTQSQTAVAPAPHRPNPPQGNTSPGFAADLPRDERGFAPALSMDTPGLPPFETGESAAPEPRRARSGRFVALMLAVPVVVAVAAGGLWVSGILSSEGSAASELYVATASVDGRPDADVDAAVTWDQGFRATPAASEPQVGEPAWFTPPMLRRLEPGELVTPEVVEVVEEPVAVAAPAPRPKSTRKKRRRRRPSGRSSQSTARPQPPAKPASRPPPPPPRVPTKKKSKPARDTSAPWKRAPGPSDRK